jgi:hypothetical protein
MSGHLYARGEAAKHSFDVKAILPAAKKRQRRIGTPGSIVRPKKPEVECLDRRKRSAEWFACCRKASWSDAPHSRFSQDIH